MVPIPVYEFACACGQESSTVRPMSANTTDKECLVCGEVMARRFTGFSFHRWETAYNPAVGKEVGSMKQFRQELKRAGEEQTARDGIPRNYVPTDIKPVEGPGTDDQARAQRKLGNPDFRRKKDYF